MVGIPIACVFSLRAIGSLTMLQKVYGQYKLDLVFVIVEVFGWRGLGFVRMHRVGRQTWEDQEVSVIRGHCIEFPNN